MRYLRTNTAVIITVGPFYDKTDGVTIETALTITNERITLAADTDDNSAPTNVLDNVTGATSGTSNDLNYITGNDAGMMQLELSASNTNRLGRMLLSITDAANHVPVFHEFMVLPAMIYDALILGTDRLDTNITHVADTAQTARDIGASVLLSSGTGTGQLLLSSGVASANAVQISGDSTAADNIEAAFDDTAGAVPWLFISHQGTLQSVTSTTVVVLAASASSEDDVYNGHTFYVVSATTGAKQSVIANDYVGSSKTLTLSIALDVALTGTVVYKLGATGRAASSGSGLDAAGVRAAIGLASANLDTQLSGLDGKLDTIDNFLDTEIAAILAAVDTEIAAIKAKTDQMVFTIANQVNATTVTNSDKTGYTLTADIRIKKNTALNNFTFLMVDASDVPATGLTVVAERSLDGGALASMANSAAEISNGLYKINLATADTNADICTYRFTATGAKDRIVMFPTQTE